MNKADVSQIVALMTYLPNAPKMDSREAMSQLVDVFHAVLQDLDAELGRAAALHYLSNKTFFPAPGDLRAKAMEINTLADNVPSPAEAWGQVLGAIQHVPSVWCERGANLRDAIDGKIGKEYWNAIGNYADHKRDCTECKTGGLGEVYGHKVVEQTVKMLGGRDVLMTDNPTADRARFIEAYKEIVAREKAKDEMLPAVRQMVEKQKTLRAPEAEMKQLAKGMSHAA